VHVHRIICVCHVRTSISAARNRSESANDTNSDAKGNRVVLEIVSKHVAYLDLCNESGIMKHCGGDRNIYIKYQVQIGYQRIDAIYLIE